MVVHTFWKWETVHKVVRCLHDDQIHVLCSRHFARSAPSTFRVVLNDKELEIWPQMPRYFAAAIAMRYAGDCGTSVGGLTLVLTWLMAGRSGWHLWGGSKRSHHPWNTICSNTTSRLFQSWSAWSLQGQTEQLKTNFEPFWGWFPSQDFKIPGIWFIHVRI